MSEHLNPHFDDVRAYEASNRPPIDDIMSRGRQRRVRRTTGLVAMVMAAVVATGATYAVTRDGAEPSIAQPPPLAPTPSVTVPPPSETPGSETPMPSLTSSPSSAPSASASSSRPPSASATRSSSSPAAPSTTAPPSSTAPSSSTAPPSSPPSGQAGISDSDRLTTSGIGPLKLGMTAAEMTAMGVGVKGSDSICPAWGPTQALKERGIGFIATQGSPVVIYLTSPRHTTLSGARVGMTVGQVKQLYGTRGVTEIKDGVGGQFAVYTVIADGREIAFMTENYTTSAKDSDVVTTVALQNYNKFLGWDGC